MVKMFKKSLLICVIVLSFFSLNVTAVDESENDCIYYFYGYDCDECSATNAYLIQLQNKYPNLNLQKFEAYYNLENAKLLREYFTAYNVPLESQGLPVIFMSGVYFIGEEPIRELLDERIKSSSSQACPARENPSFVGIVGEKSPRSALELLGFAKVTGAAFKNAFNPAAIALILIFLIIFLAIEDQEDMLKKGFIYIGGVYLAYFLFGMGMFSWFTFYNMGLYFYKIIGVISILVSLGMIKSFFGTWKILFKNISSPLKHKLNKLVRSLTSPAGVFFIGLILSIFTFGKVESTFLLIRILVTDRLTRWVTFPLILYYVLIFVLLLVMVVLLLYYIRQRLNEKAHKKEPYHERKATLWKKHYLKVLNFIISGILLIFGIVILFV